MQVKYEDLQTKVGSMDLGEDPKKIQELEKELKEKYRKLRNLNIMIEDLREAKLKHYEDRSRMYQIDKPKATKSKSRKPSEKPKQTQNYELKSKLKSETFIPNKTKQVALSSDIVQIFDFAGKELTDVKTEKEKVTSEYKLVSSLRNNLHKKNVSDSISSASWKMDLSSLYMPVDRKKTLYQIYNQMEDQSYVLETEKRDLAFKIDKCERKERLLSKIVDRQDIVTGTTSK